MAGHAPTAPSNVTPLPVTTTPQDLHAPAGRPPRWRAGLALGTPIGLSLASYPLGLIMLAIATAAVLALAGAALYGSDRHSERAFRMMRWLASRPEPPAPAGGQTGRRAAGMTRQSASER
jgi:hypothetical protein